jgi:hypothetical protein
MTEKRGVYNQHNLGGVLAMGKLREALSFKPETIEKFKVGIWGVIGGAIITMMIGFYWGGWETASSAQKMNEDAVLKSQATICVAQFMGGVKYKENIAEFQKLEGYAKSGFIANGGWDRMPGEKEANFGVKQACAEGLEALSKK